jgi:hypothetical protein
MTITSVTNYKTDGESTSSSRGYGIYPSGIDINDQGDVNSWGGPLADPCDPGSGDGLGKSSIVVELGSLYAGDSNAPVVVGTTSGTLCNVVVDFNGATSATMTITDEDTYRGGVVKEDGNTVSVNSNCSIVAGGPLPVDTNCIPHTHPAHNAWKAVGEPNCWCYPRQCHGDADGLKEGSTKTGYYYVYTKDYQILINAWKLLDVNDSPDGNGICADFKHNLQGSTKTGYYRVYTDDYQILINHWKILDTADPNVEPNCITQGTY